MKANAFFLWLEKRKLLYIDQADELTYFVGGWLGLIVQPIYWLIWTHIIHQPYESPVFRLLCSALATPIILRHYWPKTLQAYVKLYWFVGVMLHLPFTFAYLALKNDFSAMYLVCVTMSVILVAVIFPNILTFLCNLLAGWLLAYGVYLLAGEPAIQWSLRHWMYILPLPMAILLTMALSYTQKEYLAYKIDELNEANEKLKLANSVKSKFLSVISHEFKTPLHGIVSAIELIKFSYLSADQLKCIETLEVSTDRLNTLINNILDYSRLDAGNRVTEDETFSPHQTIDRLVALVSPRRHRGVQVRHSATSRVPNSLHGDVSCWCQVVLNLLTNAVKYTHTGTITIKLDVESEHTSDITLKVSIIDTGIGIAPEFKEHVFSSFRQGDERVSRNYEGAGLGLSICRKLLHSVGGDIGFNSDVGKGSHFWFYQNFKSVSPQPSHE